MSHLKTVIALAFIVIGIVMILQSLYSGDFTTAPLEGAFGIAFVLFVGIPILVSHVSTKNQS